MKAIKTIIKKYQEISSIEFVSIVRKVDLVHTKEDIFKVDEVPEDILRLRTNESNATLKDSNHLIIKK